MATRIYLVKQKDGGGRKRLVRASSPSSALRHVVEDTLEVSNASQDDLVEVMTNQDNTAVEVAGDSPNPSTV